MSEFSILTPNAMLGYGYRSEHFWYGIERFAPKAIIVDSGSTDGGPYKLGLNKMTCGRDSYIRDLTPILQACFHRKIQVLIGSVGGDGSDLHVKEMFDIIREISAKEGFSFKVATISAGFNRDLLNQRIEAHQVSPCGPVEELTLDSANRAIDIVAQMGAEPYLKALESQPDIILGGRSYDPAPFAAFSMFHGVQPGVAWHMGKIMECGGICAVPKGRSMIATLREDSFDLTPLSPRERCTPLSVAAHTLYEKTRPDRLPGPGGVLELDNASYEQLTEKTVRVRGARFVRSPVYQVKLEGVEQLGYRTIFIGGIRDPILISQIDRFLAEVRAYTQNLFPQLDQSPQCQLLFHFYGRNGTMGPIEPTPTPAHELGILGEVVAPSQELSYTIANNARASILHMPYENQVATTGNFASPLSPHETAAGPVFRFNVYHLVNLTLGEEAALFPVQFAAIHCPRRPDCPIPGLTDVQRAQIESETLEPLSFKPLPQGECQMLEIAKIIRSKNSGPFELTFDIMFDTREAYERVKDADILTSERIMGLYHLQPKDIITNMFFEPALAWKCTIRRPWQQGTVGERDTLGTQQHGPLLTITVPTSSSASKLPTAIASRTPFQDRSHFRAKDSVAHIWGGLGLPPATLNSLHLPGHGFGLPSSFKIAHLAQTSIGLSALLAAQIQALRNNTPVPTVTVPLQHAAIEFKSERLYTLANKPAPSPWGPIGGLHRASDGYVRLHDSFPNHRDGAKALLGCFADANRQDVAAQIASWRAVDLESAAFDAKIVISALRSYSQWDMLPQARAIADFPILLRKIGDAPAGLPSSMQASSADKCLRGLRVLELSRVIAAPLAGKTLAAHGADVLWVTSPNLPNLPTMDRDFGRGKRTIQVDLTQRPDDLWPLLDGAHVFIQGFRPESLAARGFAPAALAARYAGRGIICANMSAYGPDGPWAGRRGFDSLIQTCSGMNVSEAEHFGAGEPARPTPCQALDHAGGYFLAAGIEAALYKQATEGGSWSVDVSLAGVMKYLRSLGQWEGRTGFQCRDYTCTADVPDEYLETRETGFGVLTAVRHSASIENVQVGWDLMPKPLGADEMRWL
ncbi:beta-N-acetylglucosaminidase [Aspergillus steynii IBT 23096]|uniref:Beta-N-acetylglucosaminidase n=1 Tax=Aspergillus steynii IBT 23096 TaxID=1392250 RepID=A0A2I2GKU3_9EURO|nr:beta-N-acetylglucosaminidase [Aspergillus steynii IBT 23096]PLB53500.1 beta-N-acetylglucosaminidase [Aspergillus steynii IBT 23096]